LVERGCTYGDGIRSMSITILGDFRVEASITDHLRDFALDMEKYKVVQFFPL
jgi:hypothetical protein